MVCQKKKVCGWYDKKNVSQNVKTHFKKYIYLFSKISLWPWPGDGSKWRPPQLTLTGHICRVGSESHLRSVQRQRERRECTRPSQLSASQKRTWNRGIERRWGSGVTHSAHAPKRPTHTHLRLIMGRAVIQCISSGHCCENPAFCDKLFR